MGVHAPAPETERMPDRRRRRLLGEVEAQLSGDSEVSDLHFDWIPRNYSGSLFLQPSPALEPGRGRDAVAEAQGRERDFCERRSPGFQNAIASGHADEHLGTVPNIENLAILDTLIRTFPSRL
jgi:hypothetical protein